jgi:putative hemolysin
MIIVLIYIILTTIILYLGYTHSLYSSATYIEPEKVEHILSKLKGFRRRYAQEIEANPKVTLQLSLFFKSFLLIVLLGSNIYTLSYLRLLYSFIPIIAYPISIVIIWILYLIIIEYLPRRRILKVIESDIIRSLSLLTIVYLVFKPILYIYNLIFSIEKMDRLSEDQKEDIIERAIETLADQAGVGEPIVEEDEKEMIGQIFQLDVTEVREVMIPRIDMVGIDKDSSLEDAKILTKKYGFSRYPVYDENPDKIIGILYIKDLFTELLDDRGDFDITKHVRPPYFVSEKKKISELLSQFKANKVHIAIVVDEYGGTSGLVTLEDILEEIFGEIQDEHDFEREPLERLPDNSFRVDARFPVEKLIDELNLDYETEEFETVGGLLYDLVGSVPSIGTTLKWKDVIFEVDKVDGQRIVSVKVWVKKNTES